MCVIFINIFRLFRWLSKQEENIKREGEEEWGETVDLEPRGHKSTKKRQINQIGLLTDELITGTDEEVVDNEPNIE